MKATIFLFGSITLGLVLVGAGCTNSISLTSLPGEKSVIDANYLEKGVKKPATPSVVTPTSTVTNSTTTR